MSGVNVGQVVLPPVFQFFKPIGWASQSEAVSLFGTSHPEAADLGTCCSASVQAAHALGARRKSVVRLEETRRSKIRRFFGNVNPDAGRAVIPAPLTVEENRAVNDIENKRAGHYYKGGRPHLFPRPSCSSLFTFVRPYLGPRAHIPQPMHQAGTVPRPPELASFFQSAS